MSDVYYQFPTGQTLTISVINEPDDTPETATGTEIADGLYVFDVETKRDVATVLMSGTAVAGGTIKEVDGKLWIVDRQAASEAVISEEQIQEITSGVVAGMAGSRVTIVSPVNQRGTVTIVAGDDYATGVGQVIVFSIEGGGLPDLTGATITFTARCKAHPNAEPIVGVGTLLDQEDGDVTIRVEITSEETSKGSTYADTDWTYDVRATTTGGLRRTLVGPGARCIVLRGQTGA